MTPVNIPAEIDGKHYCPKSGKTLAAQIIHRARPFGRYPGTMTKAVVAVLEHAMMQLRNDEAVTVDSFVAMRLGRLIGWRDVAPRMLRSGNIAKFSQSIEPCRGSFRQKGRRELLAAA
ncbi:hypothetical protein F9288_03195 [Sphingomonas sp. CL5.1]|uniref:hypothetical protein n=1 Tax=Sphingomonas sp. CL5.1 TaxID=2653203 RepID=UPI00158243A9|nr:hypothetical protein [Sphingomonas sp. CL5.1]QKR98758.1 hypothetical protein F9288_03195 [Sphingomonas sp. CL5.1]